MGLLVVTTIALMLARVVPILCDKSEIYEQITSLRNIDTADVPLVTSAASITEECGLWCLQEPYCSSFRFHESTCSLFETTPQTSGMAAGAVYFVKIGETNQATCPVFNGYTLVESHHLCLKVNSTFNMWNESQAQFELEGGRLIILNNNDTFDYVHQWMKSEGHFYGYWVGMKRKDGVLKWTDDGSTNVRMWSNGSPPTSDCADLYMDMGEQKDGIHAWACDGRLLRSICEITLL